MTPRIQTPSTRHPPARSIRGAPSVVAGIADLRRKLTDWDETDLSDLFLATPRVNGSASPYLLPPTRLHALADAKAFLAALVDLHRLMERPSAPARTRRQAAVAKMRAPSLISAPDVDGAVALMNGRVAAICLEAGMHTPEAVHACHHTVRSVARYMRGVAGHIFGKARQRRLTAIRRDAKRLLAALPGLNRSAMAHARARRNQTSFARASAASDTLQTLLPRLIGNASRMLDELELAAPGGAAVPDPVPYGAECALAIWLRHHPRVPNLSTNDGGFLVFGEALLNLSVEALGPIRPAWLHRTTLNTALRDQVKLFRCATRN